MGKAHTTQVGGIGVLPVGKRKSLFCSLHVRDFGHLTPKAFLYVGTTIVKGKKNFKVGTGTNYV